MLAAPGNHPIDDPELVADYYLAGVLGNFFQCQEIFDRLLRARSRAESIKDAAVADALGQQALERHFPVTALGVRHL